MPRKAICEEFMIKTTSSIILVILFNISNIKAGINPHIINKVIYGFDSRMDVFESSDNLLKELSHSVAAQIMDSSFSSITEDKYVLGERTLKDEGMCASEKFSNQVAEANCSGFLIAEDVLVTAGHCVRDEVSCLNHHWVFDYANYESEKKSYTFSKDQVFRCTKVLAFKKDEVNGNDYSVIRLDRKVKGRTLFKMRKTGKVSDDTVLSVLGFPSGLPLKIATGAVIRDNTNPIYFRINSDTYSGNSGSPVIDTRTGLIEGILVRGDIDYIVNMENSCYQSVVRGENEGRGEDVTRITNFHLKL